METQDINTVLSFMLLMVVAGIGVARESTTTLDWLSDWAASRSWGLKCQQREMKEREERRRLQQAEEERQASLEQQEYTRALETPAADLTDTSYDLHRAVGMKLR